MLQPQDLEGRGDDHLLLVVVRRSDTLGLESIFSTDGLGGAIPGKFELYKVKHTTNSPPTVLQKILDGALKRKGPLGEKVANNASSGKQGTSACYGKR